MGVNTSIHSYLEFLRLSELEISNATYKEVMGKRPKGDIFLTSTVSVGDHMESLEKPPTNLHEIIYYEHLCPPFSSRPNPRECGRREMKFP